MPFRVFCIVQTGGFSTTRSIDDIQKLILAGVIDRDNILPIEDTDGLAHLINPHGVKKLKHLARTILGEDTDEDEAIRAAKRELQKQYKKDTGRTLYSKDIDYSMLPREVVIPYALKDAEFTYRLWQVLRPQVERYPELLQLYENEMELTLVLLDIEAAGMKVDLEYVNAKIKQLNGKILGCELRIQDITGLRVWYPEKQGQKTPEGCINPNAGGQIMSWFSDEGIDLENTQKGTLATMEHPLARELEQLRSSKKLLTTYLLNMKNDQRDGIIHPSYKQHEPKTGRMSSGGHTGD